jgi:integrase
MTSMTLAALERDVEHFLEFKRAMGYTYRRAEFTLESLKRFAHAQKPGSACRDGSRIDLAEVIRAWLSRSEGRKANSIAAEFGIVRQLCLYRRRRDPKAFVPDRAWAPKSRLPYMPYIFSRSEVSGLLAAAENYRHAQVGPGAMRTLLLILYCTGLRFGEAVRLQQTDVDLARCTFFIRESKGRSRYVPFGTDLAREITRWLTEREKIACLAGRAETDALLLRDDGSVLDVKRAGEAVTRLVRLQGLKPSRGRTGPRPYDWRHTHAVHRLTDWYRRGLDIHARLPWLSAYMGHLNVLGTAVYLHATPELLRMASRRLKRRLQLAESSA